MDNNLKVRKALWEVVGDLSNEQLNKVETEGKWSIAQVLDHLYLTEMALVQGLQYAKVVDTNNPIKLRKLNLVVDRSQKAVAPKYLEPTNEAQTLEALKEKLDKSREALMKAVDNLNEEDLKEKYLPHPVFKNLTLGQWIEFIGYHEERHLEQIKELKSALKI